MEKMMGCTVLAFGLMVLVLNATASPSNNITCTDVVKALLPCKSFLVGLCVCFKDVAKKLGVNLDRARSIPKFCDTNVPVPIDPNVDCSK
ncbi:hypothetical protein CJ030_MR1G020551 [Morella rubra]|uniref:Bifunctional inhibitor/plant lipid transfer protein/seed storage helical domain-containing protein n=1 Tax=Morella rubra TaxID=262757 RepID=A0A6A1WRB8_9ROSI|nr:hypothetical protein CJ030_MR1G020551 [Morella rubra]